MLLEKSSPRLPDVIVVDGLWGSGKSLIVSVVQAFEGVPTHKGDPTIEFLTALKSLGKIDEDAYSFMILNHLILSYYRSIIGRELNLRVRDQTSVLRHGEAVSSLMRLLSPEGDDALRKAYETNKSLLIMSHILVPILHHLAPVVGERLRVVNIRRHPLAMLNHWSSFLASFDRPREATVSGTYSGVKIPWFAATWASEFASSSPLEQAMLGIARCQARERATLSDLALRETLFSVRFESLLAMPVSVVNDLHRFLGRSPRRRLNRVLKRLELPFRVQRHSGRSILSSRTMDLSPSERDAELAHLGARVRECVLHEFRTAISDYEHEGEVP